ncbi:MAG TPA: arginine--tRNA ligase, partial [Actinobacteria bacterium]|nr:arginine--tRNA ligase [Actinomycetes bacterium]HEX21353.1 arginine--tRNA ligase [Actinomycetota bacterium]
AYKQVLNNLKHILTAMNVHFDNWFSEQWLHRSGYLKETIAELKVKGHLYEKEGALWLKTSNFGDDKDRVLIRANGEPTYFAADIAYHRHKLERGYKKLINIWGADHHGYVKRMQAAMVMLGAPEDTLEIIIGQLVNLFSGNRQIRMSKRTGEMVTLEELLKEIGSDAARYFFLMRSPDTPLDFDIELAKSQTSDNPVYYVQYAHARICSILRKAAAQEVKPDGFKANLELLTADPELALMRIIAEWPLILKQAAERRCPYRLTQYAENLATSFHFFYHECRVISDDSQLTAARLSLVDSTRMMLKNVLSLMGIGAPEKM